ncbi:MAG: UDP-N-acetylmuramoyl-L-alanine--D-glutamate ligase [Bacteroidales bacterium]|nr:UDP-N-acetylmuramoyl-L-alanine--D-glutamate ligase [Bacteroidales bacterium]
MNEELYKLTKGKRILILGFGREGQASFNLLRKYFPEQHLTIADKNPDIKDIQGFDFKNTSFNLGDNYLKDLNNFDLILKTPGIALHKYNIHLAPKILSSQTDIFLKLFGNQTIGITGTKGKSTTSELIYHILNNEQTKAVKVGNMGIAPFLSINDIKPQETNIVYELSCHQLHTTHHSPYIGIWLNIFREHLDYYNNFDDYQLSKFNITRFQNRSAYLIFNSDDENIVKLLVKYSPKRHFYKISLRNKVDNGAYIKNNSLIFSFKGIERKILDINSDIPLQGDHNLVNIMAAVITCKLKKVQDEQIVKGIMSFKPLPHRIEYVGEFKNIHFYNDSIATIPEATIEALKTIKNVDTIILGGYDRGLDYSSLLGYILHLPISNIICLDKVGDRICDEFQSTQITSKNCFKAQNMEEAVKIAKEKTKIGAVCLLSPAAASYGMFKDFQDRGDTFKKFINQI